MKKTLLPGLPEQTFRLIRGLVLAGPLVAFLGLPEAQAQWGAAPLRPAEIIGALRRRGFDEIGRMQLDGATYRLEATDRRGDRVGLVVDAYDAAILERSFRDSGDEILPPRNVGRAPRGGAFDEPPQRRAPDFGSRALDDLPEIEPGEQEARTELGDLPPAPGSVYREDLPAPLQDLRTPQPPPAVETLGRQADRVPPPPRGNPLALPEASAVAPPPAAVTPSRPSSTPLRGATIGPAPALPAKQAPPEAKSATADAPRPKVRIIDGVTPVMPRDTPEGVKPN